jgi:hypothetical protein
MATKKKSTVPKETRSGSIISLELDDETDTTLIHFTLTGRTGMRIREILEDKRNYLVGTCCAVGCNVSYAYSGRNPSYCPKHLGGKNQPSQAKPLKVVDIETKL